MLPLSTVQTWDYDALSEWVADINIYEDDWFDFKEAYEHSSAENVRKSFAALSNTKGGYLFFGIKDGSKEVIGCPQADFTKIISDKLSPAAIDPLPRWSLINTIELPTGQNRVHIVEVKKLPRFNKPVICDGKIYTRAKGQVQQLTRLSQLKDSFFDVENIIIEDIDVLEKTLQTAQRSEYSWTMFDTISIQYLTRVKNFIITAIQRLGDEGEAIDEWELALDKLNAGFNFVQQVHAKSNTSLLDARLTRIIPDDNATEELVNQARNNLEDFIFRVRKLIEPGEVSG